MWAYARGAFEAERGVVYDFCAGRGGKYPHAFLKDCGLGRFLLDGDVPIDNNHIENQIRPWALGRRNWLFIGSQLAGERAAVVMSLLQSAKLSGHEPWAYLKDVLTRLPTQLNSRIEELLPHRWRPAN